MFRNKHISDKLYDYLTGQVGEADRAALEQHLADCPQCAEERTKAEEALRILKADQAESLDLPDKYWENYWTALESRLETTPPLSTRFMQFLRTLKPRDSERIFIPRLAYGFIGFVIGAVITLGLLYPYLGKQSRVEVGKQEEASTTTPESGTFTSVTAEMTEPLIQFFQRVKAFLIAVKNFDESKDPRRELITEQETSKQLVAECRKLRRQTLDPREEQLLSELDVVLIQLSKIRDESDSLRLNLVREGMERNNLLMKIRVHELANEVKLLQATQRSLGWRESF